MIEALSRRVASTRRMQPAELVMLAAFGVFCFIYPFATLLLSLDLMPFGMEWMSSLLLAVLGLTAWAWLWVNFGETGVALGAILFLSGIALEYLGVSTGLPFGSYRYTGVLVPELPGAVPLAIGFAWLFIVVSGLFTARRIVEAAFRTVPPHLSPIWPALLLGASLAVGLDLLLEPVAYHVKRYWEWLGNVGGYYGVPWSNFAAWFIAALAMSSLTIALSTKLKSPNSHSVLRWHWLPVALYGMNVAIFGIVNLAHGFWAAGVITLLLFLLIAGARFSLKAG